MGSECTFQPLWASPPGDTIAELLRRRQINVSAFACDLGGSEEEVTGLLSGESAIDRDVAERLRDVLGGSVNFWLKREAQYREGVARAEGRVIEQECNWLAQLPLRDMAAWGWIERFRNKSEQARECLKFFGVSSIEDWHSKVLPVQSVVAFRASSAHVSSPAAVAAWLRKGEISSEGAECAAWNPKKFAKLLPQIRNLTKIRDPLIFVPKIQSLCATAGVAVVILRAPLGCPVSGATRFLSNGKALLLLSFRYKSDDHFWFTFFHEAGHLILHDCSALFVEGANLIPTEEEREADRFSERMLIPDQHRGEMLAMPLSKWTIARFARKIGIAPGIVVGQLQHAQRLPHDRMNRFKVRYAWA